MINELKDGEKTLKEKLREVIQKILSANDKLVSKLNTKKRLQLVFKRGIEGKTVLKYNNFLYNDVRSKCILILTNILCCFTSALMKRKFHFYSVINTDLTYLFNRPFMHKKQ